MTTNIYLASYAINLRPKFNFLFYFDIFSFDVKAHESIIKQFKMPRAAPELRFPTPNLSNAYRTILFWT